MSATEINTNVRLFDLVRYMRSELHEAALITDEEYAWLCAGSPMANSPKGGSPSRERLEDYDELRAELTRLRADNAYLKLQRDRLLEITWLDLPDEPHESTKRWEEEFAKGWERKSVSEQLRAELAEARNLLSRAADALEMSYDAQEWPANGESSQEKVAAEIRATLDRKGEKE